MPGKSVPSPTDLSQPPEFPSEPLPPRVTPILTAAINDPTMPSPLFRSYARLYAASWRNAYRRTDALDFDAELVPLLGVRPTQARQHLRYLRFAKLLFWESDGNNRYVIHFLAPPGFANPESVVGDVFNLESIDIQQQQLKDSENPVFRKGRETVPASRETGRSAGGAARQVPAQEKAGPGEGSAARMRVEGDQAGEAAPTGEGAQPETYREALSFLERAGVWPDVAERIANKLVENQRRGHSYLPSLADVLGWIAYCFGDGEKNNIDQPAAVLAANLKANRRCPEKYRPRPVCSACGFEEGFCECEGEPDYHFPAGFLDFALKRRDGFSPSAEYSQYYGFRPITIWGVCRSCHGFPCQCEED
jgi:hypothetical protein